MSSVLFRLDYCNVLFIGKSPAALHDLQVAQNCAVTVEPSLVLACAITSSLPSVSSIGCLSTSASGTRCSICYTESSAVMMHRLPPRHGDRVGCVQDPVVWQRSTAHCPTDQLQDTCGPALFCGCSNLLEPSA